MTLFKQDREPTVFEIAEAFDLLGLPQTVAREDIRRFTRGLLRATHSDLGGQDSLYRRTREAIELAETSLQKPIRPSDLRSIASRISRRRGFLLAAMRYYALPAEATRPEPEVLVRVVQTTKTVDAWICIDATGQEHRLPLHTFDHPPSRRAIRAASTLLWFS